MINNNRIKVLDEAIAKKIAAGEVVERPASVVKELLENSIDAHATNITIEIKEGGKDYISISDNGVGIAACDSKLAFIRHATSKISSLDDLYNINQMGFRGEALYSISAVSKVTLISKVKDETIGSYTKVDGGEITENHEYGCPQGTTVIVEDLFYNTPARKKFMSRTSVETANVSAVIQKYILSHPTISFKFINNGKVIYYTNGDGALQSSVFAVYGKNIASNIVEFDTDTHNGISIKGCLGNKTLINKTRAGQIIFINNRYIKDRRICMGIETMYSSLLMKHSYPFFIINITIDPLLVDVNVHPQKLNVAFSDAKQVITTVQNLLEPYLDRINNQIISFNTQEKIKTQEIEEKNENTLSSTNDIIESNNIVHDTTLSKNRTENTNESVMPSLGYEINEFNYKSALLLNKKSSNSNLLKQNNTAENINYEQVEIKNLSKAFNVIGALFNSYLVIECNENIYIFDQHAAHERLIYEQYSKKLQSEKPITQKLLIPQTIELSYDDIIAINENIDAFNQIGYELYINDTCVNIVGVPVFLGQPRLEVFFKELLASIKEDNKDKNSVTNKIISMSCKKAVKAGDKLSNNEIEALINLIIDEDTKLSCPHGRPFVMVMTKKQIEKGFGRIV